MSQDVLINFVGSTEQLKPVEDVLETIIDKGDEVGQAWKKTSADMDAGTKKNVESTSKLAKSIEAMAVAAKSADKVVIGGAYNQYLKELQKSLGLTSQELITYIKNARTAAQQQVILAGSDKEAEEFSISIQVMNDQLRELGALEEETGSKTSTLRTRIKEAKDELIKMSEAGLAGTPAFIALQEHAGELQKEFRQLNATIKDLGSDTRHIDGLISLASGVAGGFAVAQGAAALFGDGQEEIQKALLKVNAAMSILQGLQAVQNVLQKESAASLLFNTGATQANAAAKAQLASAEAIAAATAAGLTEAEIAQAGATAAATVEVEAMNVAFLANPVGLLIAGIAALVGVLYLFSGRTKDQKAEQDKLNDAIREGTVYVDNYLAALDHQRDRQIADAKLAGKTAIELSQIEGKAGNDRIQAIYDAKEAASKAYNESKADDEESIKAKAKLYDVYVDLDKKYEDEYRNLQIKGIEFRKEVNDNNLKSFIAFQEAKVAATRSGSIAEKNAEIQAIKDTRAAKDKLDPPQNDGERAKRAADDARQISDIQLAIYAYQLKSQTSMQEANLAAAKASIIQNQSDSIASIRAVTAAEIAAIKARTNEQLKSNPNLSAGEIAKIQQEANLQILDLEQVQQQKILEIRKVGIEAELVLAQKGSRNEYDLKIKSIEAEQDAAIAAANGLQEKINLANANAEKAKLDALRFYNDAQLQNQISYDNAALDKFGLLENEKLTITLKRLNENRQLEISDAEGNAAKIAEINAKYLKAEVDARLAANKAVLDDNLRNLQIFGEISRAKNTEILGNADKYSIEQRQQANKALYDADVIALDLSLSTLQKNLSEKNITQGEYNLQYQDLLNKRSAMDANYYKTDHDLFIENIDKKVGYLKDVASVISASVAAVLPKGALSTAIDELGKLGIAITGVAMKWDQLTSEERKNALKALASEGVAAAQDIINQAFADASTKRNEQLQVDLANLEDAKNKELKVENLTAQQKADIDQRFSNQAKQLKKQAFEEDKRAKKAQAIINGLLGVSLAIAEYPWPYSLIVAGITAGFAAIQVEQINNTSAGFKDGVINLKGPGTSTSDSINARLSVGESVIPAKQTKKHIVPLTHIYENTWDDYVEKLRHPFVFPIVPEYVSHSSSNVSIDYEKMGDSIASKLKIPAPLKVTNNFDKNGWNTWVEDQNSKTQFLNNRFSMP